jgi:hypothetical protein
MGTVISWEVHGGKLVEERKGGECFAGAHSKIFGSVEGSFEGVEENPRTRGMILVDTWHQLQAFPEVDFLFPE